MYLFLWSDGIAKILLTEYFQGIDFLGVGGKMDISIKEMWSIDEALSMKLDSDFTIDSMLNLTINGGQIGYTVTELAGYRKSYEELSAANIGDSASAGRNLLVSDF